MVTTEPELDAVGAFEAPYVAFLETVTHLRPRLHRYCARMTGSVLDGEDVMQEALFEAYRKLGTFDDNRPMSPWLFRIVHNRCIDFLRRRSVREDAEAAVAEPDVVQPVDPVGPALGRAVERLVVNLPPKERACVLLKDILDYSLDEIAELVDSTVGGVKAALNRGRAKLATVRDQPPAGRAADPELSKLLHLYVAYFNRRDWDGLRTLISADARLRVANCYAGRMAGAPYLTEYEQAPVRWRMAPGDIDGESVIMALTDTAEGWTPTWMVRLDIDDGRVTRIRDYLHCPWILTAAATVAVANPA